MGTESTFFQCSWDWKRLLFLFCFSLPAFSQATDLTSASLEELLETRVSTVGRKEQKLSKSAAAVSVLSQEDIRRTGATNLMEALRWVPGLQVSRINSSQWAISARGFGWRFSNKLLVLIDGRSVYNNVHAGVYWDELDLMLEDVERIEVIRGPGATMWGSNAVNGIINIITKHTRDTKGGLLTTTTGNEDLAVGAFRYGASAGKNINYRMYGKFASRASLGAGPSGTLGDNWRTGRGGFRVDWDRKPGESMLLTGEYTQSAINQPINSGFPFSASGNVLLDPVSPTSGFLLWRWEKQVSSKLEYVLQTSFNRTNRKEYYGEGTYGTADVDGQVRYQLHRNHDVVFGGNYRNLFDQFSSGNFFNTTQFASVPAADRLVFNPASTNLNQYSAFAQDDIALRGDKLILSVGSKFQHNPFSGFEYQPSARLIYSPSSALSIWGAVSRATRTPARRDTSIRLPFSMSVPGFTAFAVLRGNPNFQSERVYAYEAGFRKQMARWLSTDVSWFFNKYRNLQSIDALPVELTGRTIVLPASYTNTGRADSTGFESSLSWVPLTHWRLITSYSFLAFENVGAQQSPILQQLLNNGAPRYNLTPSHQVQIRSLFDYRNWNFDTNIQSVSSIEAAKVPNYTRLDVRLGHKIGESGDVSIGGTNLLDARHFEFSPEDYTQSGWVRRTFYLRATWRF